MLQAASEPGRLRRACSVPKTDAIELNLLRCTGVGPHGAEKAFIKPRTIAIHPRYDVSLC
jgi:hypothetical protein